MADEQPSLHIDSDWKRQAQEEKRRQAEAEKARQQAKESDGVAGRIAPTGVAAPTSAPAAPASAANGPAAAQPGKQKMPQASFATLVQSIVTQALYYMGDLSPRGSEPVLQLDMAKFHVDTLGLLDEKTKGNLSPEEQRMLDAALYETRMRYVQIASQFIT